MGRKADEARGRTYNGIHMRTLVVSLLFTLAVPATAQHEGFGGASAGDVDEADRSGEPHPGDDEVPDGDACLVKDDQGTWRSCEDVLSAPSPHEQEAPVDDRPPLTLPPVADEEEKPKVREINETRPAKGAFGRLVAGAHEQSEEDFPLLKLRARVEALKAEVKALEDDPIRHREAPAKKDEHRFYVDVLTHVESVGYGLVRSCIATDMPEWTETFLPPNAYRMTPGGPVLMPEEERRSMPHFDPPGCERLRLIDDATIAKVTRLHEIERQLKKGGLGYHERDQRKALLREAAAIKQELGESAAAPIPKLFSRDRDPDKRMKQRRATRRQ